MKRTQPDRSQIDEELFSIPRVAWRWCCSRSTVYRVIYDGLLPVVKLGVGRSTAVRVRLSDLVSFEAKNTTFRNRADSHDQSLEDG